MTHPDQLQANLATRKYPTIRSKAQVKRIMKRFALYNPDTQTFAIQVGKHKIRPVGWQEIVHHNIKVGEPQ